MTETKKFLINEWNVLDPAFREALLKTVRSFLDIVAESKEERQTIITNFLLYINEKKFAMNLNIPYEINKLKPTTAVLSIFYIKLSKWLFIEAWTFALSVFNYSKAIRRRSGKIPYIW